MRDFIQHIKDHYIGNSESLAILQRTKLLRSTNAHTCVHTPKAFSLFLYCKYIHPCNHFPEFSGLLDWLEPVVFSLSKHRGFPRQKSVLYFAFAFSLDLFSHYQVLASNNPSLNTCSRATKRMDS